MTRDNIPKEVAAVINGITEGFHPEKIYLFSHKNTHDGGITAFKLCVVLDCESRCQAEREIYLRVDSDIPFDVVIYSPEEFERLSERKGSFARKVFEEGVLLHG